MFQKTIEFTHQDVEYFFELDYEVSSYSPATHDYPAEGGEVEISDVVRQHPLPKEHVDLDAFLALYAQSEESTVDAVREKLHQECFEASQENLDDDRYDD